MPQLTVFAHLDLAAVDFVWFFVVYPILVGWVVRGRWGRNYGIGFMQLSPAVCETHWSPLHRLSGDCAEEQSRSCVWSAMAVKEQPGEVSVAKAVRFGESSRQCEGRAEIRLHDLQSVVVHGIQFTNLSPWGFCATTSCFEPGWADLNDGGACAPRDSPQHSSLSATGRSGSGADRRFRFQQSARSSECACGGGGGG